MNWTLSPATIFAASPIVPVMVIHNLADAIPITQALAAGGIKVFEITLRTPIALEAIKLIREALPDALVGAGTVLTPEQYDAVAQAGAQFAISPGATSNLLRFGCQHSIPLIPGLATASEMMAANELGYDHVKFFPAEANGGANMLKSLSAPLSHMRFCPTGGITASNVASYLALSCVATVGGTWMLPAEAIAAQDWATITRKSQEATELVRSLRG